MNKTLTATAALAFAVLAAVACAPAEAAEADAYGAMIDRYEAIRLALLNDRLDGVPAEAEALAKGAGALAVDFDAERAGVPAPAAEEAEALLPEVAAAAKSVAAAEDLKTARAAFAELTAPLLRYRELAGDTAVRVAYCPMAEESWLQKDDETIGNPYYGQSMAECGSFQEN
jgi:hypothetical protein